MRRVYSDSAVAGDSLVLCFPLRLGGKEAPRRDENTPVGERDWEAELAGE